MTTGVAVIIGVGPDSGLGARLCRRFASQGLHVFVAGRTQAKVDAVAQAIVAEGGQATGVQADTTSEADVTALFDQAAAAGPLRLAIFNAGNNMPGDFLTMEAEYFERCWRIACFGGFLFSREALKRMVPEGQGSLLFTGASASMRGKPNFAAFTAAKAGLRALAQSLAREFGPKGVHIGHVVVDGGIDGEKLRSRPGIVERFGGEDGLVDLEGIVDLYEMLHRQPPRAWTHEVDVRTYREPF